MPQPVLVVVDVQERLVNAMDAERRDAMVRNIKILGATARRLGVPPQLCRAYEDTDLGLQAIRAAGMDAVDVRELLTPR